VGAWQSLSIPSPSFPYFIDPLLTTIWEYHPKKIFRFYRCSEFLCILNTKSNTLIHPGFCRNFNYISVMWQSEQNTLKITGIQVSMFNVGLPFLVFWLEQIPVWLYTITFPLRLKANSQLPQLCCLQCATIGNGGVEYFTY